MASLSPNLEHLTAELPADKRADVEQAIASSPYLQQIMTEAVNASTLKHIRMGVPGANEGGHYSDLKQAIYLSPDTFTDPTLKSRPELRLDAITSTLGHETGHALNATQANKNLYFVTANVTDQISAAQGAAVDMTPMMDMYLRGARQDEAQAEIHGWNALASRLEHTLGRPPSEQEMLSRVNASTNCVTGPTNRPHLSPGIILDPDMQLSDTRLPKAGQINLEPVAQCHFDQSLPNLGAGGGANYTNYYAAYVIQQIAGQRHDQTYPARIELDMAKLGLDKAQLESTGLRLGEGGFTFTDISHDRRAPVVLRGTGGGIQGTPDTVDTALREDPQAPRTGNAYTDPNAVISTPPPRLPDPRDPDHPDHRLCKQIENGVTGIDAQRGRSYDTASERLTLCALHDAKAAGITSADHIALNQTGTLQQNGSQIAAGTRLFMLQGPDPFDPAAKRSTTDVAQAVERPVEQTLQNVEALNRQQAQQLVQLQNTPTPDTPTPKGPTM